MSTYYAVWAMDDTGHVCNNCKIDDGRATLYWKESDFDLCHQCLLQLTTYHIDPHLKDSEALTVRRMAIPESLRNEIFARDGGKCIMCGSGEHIQIDHVKPFSRGGTTTKDNLQTLCRACNLAKRAR
jgi:5-methylcytosine-specific restriction endonuclease McrA